MVALSELEKIPSDDFPRRKCSSCGARFFFRRVSSQSRFVFPRGRTSLEREKRTNEVRTEGTESGGKEEDLNPQLLKKIPVNRDNGADARREQTRWMGREKKTVLENKALSLSLSFRLSCESTLAIYPAYRSDSNSFGRYHMVRCTYSVSRTEFAPCVNNDGMRVSKETQKNASMSQQSRSPAAFIFRIRKRRRNENSHYICH